MEILFAKGQDQDFDIVLKDKVKIMKIPNTQPNKQNKDRGDYKRN